MARKAKSLDAGQYELAGFGLAFTTRLTQALAEGDDALSAGHKLEELIDSLPTTNFAVKAAGDLIECFNSMSVKQQWRFFLKWMMQWSHLISNYFINLGEKDPMEGLDFKERAFYIAGVFGHDDLEEFALWLKQIILHALDMFANRRTTDGLKMRISEGHNTEDFSKKFALFNNLIQMATGESLVDITLATATEMENHMDSKMALLVAVEMVEKKHKWVISGKEIGFEQFWKSTKPRLLKKIKIDSTLELPGTRVVSDIGPYPEEMLFFQEAVLEELRARLSRDPMRVFQDAISGKLQNYLVRAIINRLRDQIRFSIAKRRDVRKEEVLSLREDGGEVCNNLGRNLRESKRGSLIVDAPGEENLTRDYEFEIMLSGLNENEKKVVTMAFKKDVPGERIARVLGKSESWVSGVKKRALKKLREEFVIVQTKACAQ